MNLDDGAITFFLAQLPVVLAYYISVSVVVACLLCFIGLAVLKTKTFISKKVFWATALSVGLIILIPDYYTNEHMDIWQKVYAFFRLLLFYIFAFLALRETFRKL